MNELKCHKHQVNKECMGGRSAHISNWYCPECAKEADIMKDLRQHFVEQACEALNNADMSDGARMISEHTIREKFK